jgi:hypothetical protein
MKTAYEKRWKLGINNIVFGEGLKQREATIYFLLLGLIIIFGKMIF